MIPQPSLGLSPYSYPSVRLEPNVLTELMTSNWIKPAIFWGQNEGLVVHFISFYFFALPLGKGFFSNTSEYGNIALDVRETSFMFNCINRESAKSPIFELT